MSKKTTTVDPENLTVTELVDLLGQRVYANNNPEVLTDGKLDIGKLVDAEMADQDIPVEHSLGVLAGVLGVLAQGYHISEKGVPAGRIEIRYPEHDYENGEEPPFVVVGSDGTKYAIGEAASTSLISTDSADKNVIQISTEVKSAKRGKKKEAAAAGHVRVSVTSIKRKHRKLKR